MEDSAKQQVEADNADPMTIDPTEHQSAGGRTKGNIFMFIGLALLICGVWARTALAAMKANFANMMNDAGIQLRLAFASDAERASLESVGPKVEALMWVANAGILVGVVLVGLALYSYNQTSQDSSAPER